MVHTCLKRSETPVCASACGVLSTAQMRPSLIIPPVTSPASLITPSASASASASASKGRSTPPSRAEENKESACEAGESAPVGMDSREKRSGLAGWISPCNYQYTGGHEKVVRES
eukprot:1180520-Prorocentrum_minimum.AAC.3